MLLAILTLITAGFLVFELYRINQIKKHDLCLYQFCQIRRDAVWYLADNYTEIDRKGYESIKQLLGSLNNTIGHYKAHKTVIFNYRAFAKYLEQTKRLTRKSKIDKVTNSDILMLRERFGAAVWQGFVAYTPFLKSQIFALIVRALLFAAARTKFVSAQRALEKITEALTLTKIDGPLGTSRVCHS